MPWFIRVSELHQPFESSTHSNLAGEGPVPFTYSAEAFPLYIRNIGMSFATATTWLFNFVVSLTFPLFLDTFTPQGAFGWYAAWNVIGFFLILFFVPETKALSLEELDQGSDASRYSTYFTDLIGSLVFSVPTRQHAAYQLREVPIFFKRHVLRMKDVQRQPKLYAHEYEDEKAPSSTMA